jgi:hypothetical protein
VPCPAADLFGDPVWDLGDGIQLHVQVLAARPCLASVGLHGLDVQRLVLDAWLVAHMAHRVPYAAEQIGGEPRAGVGEALVMAARPNQDLPRPRAGLDLRHRKLRRAFLGWVDTVKGVVTQGHSPNAVLFLERRFVTVPTVAAFDGQCLDGERAVLKAAVGDHR